MSDNQDRAIASRIVGELLSSQSLAYAVVAPNLTILHHSPNFDELAAGEMDSDKVSGAPLGYVVPELADRAESMARILSGTMSSFQLDDVSRPQPDGSVRYLCFRLMPLWTERPFEGLLLTVEDTTVAHRLQQQRLELLDELGEVAGRLATAERRLERAEQFKALALSMATHDLRSPLAAIFGYVDLLLGELTELTPDEQRDFLTVIHLQAQRMNRLILALLDLNQVQQGALALNTVPVDLNVIAQAAAEESERSASLQGVRVALAPATAPLPVLGDPIRLKQIMVGLIDLAIRESRSEETILLRLSLLPEGNRARARFRLSHNARSLTVAQQTHLFDLEPNSAEARQSWPPEIRLTMYLIRALVEAHHGALGVENLPDGGRLFTVELPLDRDAVDPH